MIKRSNYLMCYFYYGVVFLIISAVNILPQDNTNNMMQDKTNGSTNDLEKKIEQNANYYSSDLKTKLNLTDSQMRYIYDIMLDYYLNEPGNQTSQRAALRESKETLNQETGLTMKKGTNTDISDNNGDKPGNASFAANIKIKNILDNEQKNKWKKVNDSWWVNVKTELYERDKNTNSSIEIYRERRAYEDNRDYEDFDVYYPGYDFK